MADLTVNRGDLFPPLKATLQQRSASGSSWEPIDLTNATSVRLIMVSDRPTGTKVTGACAIASPRTSGAVEYAWEAGDTEVAGQYRCQFEITWSTGKPQTVPNEGYEIVEVQSDLAGDA